MNIECKFSIGDKVSILELGVTGRVRSIFVDSGGLQYSVRYFDDGDLKEVLFYPDELELVEEINKSPLGYVK